MAGTSGTGPLRVLARPAYRFFWTGSLASAFGSAVGGVVVTWIVFTATHSPLAIALLGVVGFLPTLLFGLLAGALIDRFDRRRLMLACDVARMVALAGLAAYTALVAVNVPVILLACLVVATFSTIFRPATNALVPLLLGSAELTDGNGLLMAATTVAGFIGSPVGGLLVLTLGVVGGLLVNALTFGFSAAMIFLMVVPLAAHAAAPPAEGPRSLLAEVREGLQYLRSQRALLAVTLTGIAANFFLSIYFQFVVIYAADQLNLGATGFGILLGANALGWAVGALLPGRLGTTRAPGLWYPLTWTFAGLSVAGLALTHSLPIATLFTVAFGLLGGTGNTTFFSAVQTTVPPHLLGRYFATDEAGSFAMIPAGQVIGGVLILLFGIAPAYLLAGLGAAAASAVLLAMPGVRAWGRTPAPARAG